MNYRGSLKQCVAVALWNFHSEHSPRLTILCNDRSAYYTVLDTNQLPNFMLNDRTADQRIVFNGTQREMMTCFDHGQLSLFPGDPNAPH